MMNKIVVRNTCIIINDYDLGDNTKLEDIFKIWDPITHRFNSVGIYYDEQNRRLYLPSGLDLWKIKSYFGEKYYDRQGENKPESIGNILIKYRPKDQFQEEALRFMIGVNEYSDNAYLNQLSVNLNTGKGKTYCSIATISYFRVKSVVITFSTTLLNQWSSEIIKYTNIKESEIFNISGSNLINMILNGKSRKAKEAKIFLVTHSTLKSFGDSYGWNNVYNLFNILGIGIKIFDEAHTNFTNMLMIDFFTNVWKTFYVTATPARSDWREDRIYQLSLKNVPGINLFDENNDPHTSYIAIKWNSKPTPQQISQCKNRYGLDRMKYIDYVTKQPNFYKMLHVIMDLVIRCKGRVLFYVGTNEGILRVYKFIGENYPRFLGEVGIFSSLVPKSEKLKEKNKKLLLSTTKSAGLGEHIEGLKMTIVLAEPFKSKVLVQQTLGRTRDDNTMYIELIDMGFKYINKFYFAKLPIFNKFAKDVSDTTIDSYELERRVEHLQNLYHRGTSPLVLNDRRFEMTTRKDESNNGPIKPISFRNIDNV